MNSTKINKFSYEFDGIEIYIFFVESKKEIMFEEDETDTNNLRFIETSFFLNVSFFNFYIINFNGVSYKFKGVRLHENLSEFNKRIEYVLDPIALHMSYFQIKDSLNEIKQKNSKSSCDYILTRLESYLLNFVAIGEKRLLHYENENEYESDMDTC